MSLLVDSNKSHKNLIVVARLIEAEVDKTMFKPPQTFPTLRISKKWPNDGRGLQQNPLRLLCTHIICWGADHLLWLTKSAKATYLSYIDVRHTCMHRDIWPCTVRMVNDIGILIINRVAPHCVMIDLAVQPIMIGKRLTKDFWSWQLRTWFLVHLSSSHPLTTWNDPYVIFKSQYNLGSE